MKGIIFGGYPGVNVVMISWYFIWWLFTFWTFTFCLGNWKLLFTNKKFNSSSGFLLSQYDYDEGLYIGQRYFDKNELEYHYPFGYVLSYSTFSFSDLNLKMEEKGLTAKFKVKNTRK